MMGRRGAGGRVYQEKKPLEKKSGSGRTTVLYLDLNGGSPLEKKRNGPKTRSAWQGNAAGNTKREQPPREKQRSKREAGCHRVKGGRRGKTTRPTHQTKCASLLGRKEKERKRGHLT